MKCILFSFFQDHFSSAVITVHHYMKTEIQPQKTTNMAGRREILTNEKNKPTTGYELDACPSNL